MAKAASRQKAPIDLGRALIQAFMTNERVNQVLIELIAPQIWRAFPPSSKRRNIATSFAHIHNVRCMRLTMSARGSKVPARLDRSEVTPGQAAKALADSADAMARLIRVSLDAGGRVQAFPPDVVLMVCLAITHEAHHRGQICHWARELGSPIPRERTPELWDWPRLSRGVWPRLPRAESDRRRL